jgi:hypothetical protein
MARVPPSLWLIGLALGVSGATRGPALQSGDLVLQVSRSAQAEAIRAATGSEWTHVGLVEVTPEGTFVIEAEGAVVRTPWRTFRWRGEEGRYLVLRPTGVGREARLHAVAAAKRRLGTPYDAAFGWGDDALYCSELVVKAWAEAGLTLGRRERLGDLRLAGLEARLRERFGERLPLDRQVVTPASLARERALTVVERR